MARTLILDGHCSAALAFVRSLGRAGHYVVVGSEERFFAPSTHSRYCCKSYHYPSPALGMEAFLEVIKDIVNRECIDAIFPMTDATVWPLSYRRERFPRIKIALPPHESITLVSDKLKTIELAEKIGVPVPETMTVDSPDQVDLLLKRNWRYPIVLKDRFSIRWEKGCGVTGGVDFAFSESELVTKILATLRKTGDILVQQYTGGVGVGFSCFSLEDEIIWPFQWERIREKDPRGSGSSARKSKALDRKILDYSTRLVKESGFQGICMVEFKRNFETGELILMEINGRPWGSLQLPIHAGYDYPKAVIDWLLRGKVPQRDRSYKKDITCRWLVADLIHLENVLEGSPKEWPVPFPGMIETCLKVALPWYPGLRYDHLSWNDPRPGIAELYRWFKSHLP